MFDYQVTFFKSHGEKSDRNLLAKLEQEARRMGGHITAYKEGDTIKVVTTFGKEARKSLFGSQ